VDGRVQGRDQGLFLKAVELEYRYAEDTMPRGVLGLNASMFKGYLRYIANRRATQIGLEALFPNEENPFPWMSEMIDLKKERNFLRDPRHRIPIRWRAVLGLRPESSCAAGFASKRSRFASRDVPTPEAARAIRNLIHRLGGDGCHFGSGPDPRAVNSRSEAASAVAIGAFAT
jgi:hypothetical protein